MRGVRGTENADALPGHHVRLTDGDLVLRPMRENDLPQAMEWDNDPEVRHFMQAATVPRHAPSEAGQPPGGDGDQDGRDPDGGQPA